MFKEPNRPLQLITDENLFFIPFEWLKNDDIWLWEHRPLGRTKLTSQFQLIRSKSKKSSNLHFLLIKCHDFSLINAGTQETFTEIIQTLNLAKRDFGIQFDVLEEPSVDEIKNIFTHPNRYDIILFDGHGKFIEDDMINSGFVLTKNHKISEILSISKLNEIFKESPSLPFVWIALSCEAGQFFSGKIDENLEFGFNNLVDLFSAYYINFIAAPWSISIKTAGFFAMSIIRELTSIFKGRTKSLGEMVQQAKIDTRDRNLSRNLPYTGKDLDYTWLGFILFGNAANQFIINKNGEI